MKNIKQLFCGIIIGTVATVSITALAEYIVVPNSFPVKVNGQTVQVEGYNINDSTYFKLRDVANAVGGFDVDFVDGTIMVKAENAPSLTTAPTVTPNNEPVSVKNKPNPKFDAEDISYWLENGYEFTSDGLPIYVLEDGNKYVKTTDVEAIYNFKERGYKFVDDRVTDSQFSTLLEGIQIAPNTIKNNLIYTPISSYETVLSPWLQEYCK